MSAGMWTNGYIAVDWGTTNRRGYRINSTGECEGEFEDGKGITGVPSGGFPAAVAEIRERLGDLPLMMAGMVGSNRGWVEAPYVPCPAGPQVLARHLFPIEGERAAIVPGLSFTDETRADVMRGEEVQLFGAVAAGLVPPDCSVCHPGTHNKWVLLERGEVKRFRTVMTGEMFAMLQERSILSQWMDGEVEPGAAFQEGVRRGLSDDALTAELFGVRAGVLLGRLQGEDVPAFTSGLLIGADVATGLRHAHYAGEVVVMGRPELTRLYAAALKETGRNSREIDGEQAFLAGIGEIVRQIT
ncbi:2-dehydro-3-deoxygalactonokinase [uncultured Sphingomonas sp.]|uniref:2-dehydro-3-deoxygalactonokinase n=1 Tax=uncultured Sphingomonas sp. TaxID=158754 RepID=UPI0025D15557|nr:2-dehydro-3-deoxygalactonokinase [uncultured Sphingomonas sp.]